MSEISQLPLSFLWFVLQIAIFPPTLFLGLAVALVMGSKHARMEPEDKASVGWILWVLPIPVVLMALWGGWFKPTEASPEAAPRWAVLTLWGPVVVQLLMAVGITWWMKGRRTFVGAFAVFNVYLAWIMFMMTSMAMSGGWEIT